MSSPRVIVLVALVFGGVGAVTWLTNWSIAGRGLPFGLGTSTVNLPFLLAAGGTTVLWLLMIGGARLINQPRRPSAGPATQDLGPEPPALAAMLAEGFEVPQEAVNATLLDLAARGAIEIFEIEREGYAVRLRGEPRGGVLAHEQQLLTLLRQRAADGVVHAAALTTGRRDIAKGWWKAFRTSVVDAAQARGLSRDLWDWRTVSGLTAFGVVPAVFWWLAVGQWQAALVFGLVGLSLLGALQGGRRQRDTPAGLAAASRWMGVRRWIREAAFEELPPTAVAVWERHLAYAAGFGIARGAIRPFPLGADDDHLAWSAHSGEWRPVRIRYPRLWPPGWGARPALALPASLGVLAGSAFLARVAFAVGLPPFDALSPEPSTLVAGGFAVAWAVIALAGAAGLMLLVRAASDLGPAREVSGPILRVRTFGGSRDSSPRHYVALDDGLSPSIRAWRIRPQVVRGGLIEGRMARATVTPYLRCVRSIEMVEP